MKLAALASLVAGITVTALAAPASAQPALTPLVEPASAPREPLATPADAKSPTTAILLSLGGTAGSLALMVAGANSSGANADSLVTVGLLSTLVTPSLGHWYAGHYLTGGMAMRAGGGVLVIAGLAQALGSSLDSENSGSGDNGDSGAAMFLVGAGLYVGGALYDIATAPSAAERWNTTHLQLAPTMVSSGTHTTVGLGLGGSF